MTGIAVSAIGVAVCTVLNYDFDKDEPRDSHDFYIGILMYEAGYEDGRALRNATVAKQGGQKL